eukprot:6575593-Prymnesium_polylepis.1
MRDDGLQRCWPAASSSQMRGEPPRAKPRRSFECLRGRSEQTAAPAVPALQEWVVPMSDDGLQRCWPAASSSRIREPLAPQPLNRHYPRRLSRSTAYVA